MSNSPKPNFFLKNIDTWPNLSYENPVSSNGVPIAPAPGISQDLPPICSVILEIIASFGEITRHRKTAMAD
jgi:hypothetical protein